MTPRRETSIAFQTDKTPAQYRELAQLVNQYDFDVVSVYGDLPFHPSFGPLLLMAPYLERARLGPACVSPSRMTPLDMASDVSLLDQMTGGRAYLGIARGAWLERHGVKELKPPNTAVRESVEIVQMLLRGDTNGFKGSLFQIDPHVKLQTPLLRSSVPILIGTWGRQLAGIAGELATEVKIGGSANPDMVPVMKEWIAVGEQKAGRPEGSVGVVVGAVCIVDEDGVAARTAIKREVALYLPVIAALDVTLQVDPELLARIKQHVDAHEIDQAAALISDDLLAKFVFAGTPEEVLAHAQSIYDAGASRVEFGTPHGLHTATGIRLLGERVLPYLNR